MKSDYFLEACCQNAADAQMAQAHGASRIELCENLSCEGLTPSEDNILETLRSVSIPVNVLIRLREGNFVYNEEEVAEMCLSIGKIRDLSVTADDGPLRKVNAFVIGALTEEGDIDTPAVRRMLQAAEGFPVTFHRAFDVCTDPLKAYRQLRSLGFSRILTSGHAPTAMQGRELLSELVALSGKGAPAILVGGNVRPDNIDILAHDTQAVEFHSSFLNW